MDTREAVLAQPASRTLLQRLWGEVRADGLSYLLALAVTCFVFWLHLALGLATVLYMRALQVHTQGDLRGFVLLLAAVIVSAYVGGVGPGLFSTFLAAGLMDRLFLPPLNSWYIASPGDRWRLAAFVAAGIVLSALIEVQHRTRRLSQASHRLRDVTLASIGDAVITTDGTGNTTFLNSEAEKLTGWTNQQAVGRPLSDVLNVLNQETRAPAEDPVRKVLSLGAATRLTNHALLVSRSGREIPISERASPLRHPDGRIEGVVLVFRDVSESRKAEVELQKRLELQEQIARIVNTAPAVIYSFRQRPDGTTCFPFASPAIEEILGVSAEDLTQDGNAAFAHVHPDDLAQVSASTEESARKLKVWQCEFRVLSAVRGEIWMEGRSVPQREADGGTLWYGFFNDITERKQSETAIQRSEQKFRSYVENAPLAVFVADPEGRIVEYNLAAVELFGYRPAEFTNLRVLDLHPPRDQELVLRALAGLRHGGRVEGEYRCVRQNGQELWVLLRAVLLDGGYSLGFCQDITKRKGAELELRESQQRLQLAMDAGRLGVWSHDFTTDELVWDERCREIFGVAPADPISFQRFVDSIDPAGRNEVMQSLEPETLRKAGKLAVEYRIKLPDGSDRWVMARGRSTLGPSGDLLRVDGLVLDISEQRQAEAKVRQLEEQFRQAQKMEAVGRLAGGVAHDFNNLLMVIQGYTEMLHDEMPDTGHGKKYSQEVLKATFRAAGLTRQLLAFSRKQVLCPVVLNLNRVVQETSKMMARLLGEDIVFTLDLAPSLWAVEADEDQMGQVLMNLAVNARDAMPQGGTLTITTKNVCVEHHGTDGRSWVAAGDYVGLTVCDTGIGMDHEVQEHLFEPFFTTKEAGKGTGLGLATVYGIVRQSNGYVWADSQPGHGACFTIYLPATRKAVLERLSGATQQNPRGTETLLLVEDETSLHETLLEFLGGLGYTVLAAKSPQEALAVSGQYRHAIDLLITDVVMPGMYGTDLSQELQRLRPGIRTIFMSGYIDDAMVRSTMMKSGSAFLQKPFTLHILAQKVREVIGQTVAIE